MRKRKRDEQDPRFHYSSEGHQTGLNWDYYWGGSRAAQSKVETKARRKRAKVTRPVLKKKKG